MGGSRAQIVRGVSDAMLAVLLVWLLRVHDPLRCRPMLISPPPPPLHNRLLCRCGAHGGAATTRSSWGACRGWRRSASGAS